MPSRPSYSATHPDPTHVMLMVIKNKMVLCTLINLNLHETGFVVDHELQKVVKVTNYIKPVVTLKKWIKLARVLVQKLLFKRDVFFVKTSRIILVAIQATLRKITYIFHPVTFGLIFLGPKHH